ncbi:HAMP domain-containing histidine kinase [Nonlabens sp. Ci31]|jgi:signal transduction histidine kinase|uniref:sensor histidine kinase n=1 Tax=Nonlabens sp. Ci31 TaxID=2608253 RepID=UPI0014646BA2|nr:HAMP domain-containing sensor histidine kinase [Nonlabens sp. Ci31]QJP33626.1 HAMP domain-containing histidine kinase [Nonlabens sp. Ci31]
MKFTSNKNIYRWIMIVVAVMITSLILWNTYDFFQQLKENERKNIQEFGISQKDLANQGLGADLGELGFTVASNTTTVPMIVIDYKGGIETRNLPENIRDDQQKIKELIEIYKQENDPIVTQFEGKPFSTIYYGNSDIITKTKYYPMALVIIMLLFFFVIWFFYRSNKAGEQNKLWAGMAKESAHQIGTPLSSLVGWTTILKETNVDPSYIVEMEKDINRLKMITDRFSKIGSIPKLIEVDIVDQTQKATDYIANRSSKLVKFEIDLPDQPIQVKLNEPLFEWVIENLIKNGIDAMKGKGTISIYLKADVYNVFIQIKDTGKGIPKRQWNQVFKPGFTTKRRGWGLGLSLAKRIIKDYHNGKIRVIESKKDQGTTFEITLNKI